MSPLSSRPRLRAGFSVLAAALAAGVLAALGGCTTPPATGAERQAVLAAWGPPTGRYALPAGAERLEYATGPYGRMTWMVDIDSAGRVTHTRQVLNEAHFADFQARAPGMRLDELLRTLGRPGERQGAGLRGGELWSWRFPTNDCLWFQATVDTASDTVRDAGYGIDWSCDKGSAERN